LSSVATRYQLGFVFQAGSLIVPFNALTGTCESAMNCAFGALTSAAKEAAICGSGRQSWWMPVHFPRSSNGFRKISHGPCFTFCMRISRFSNTTICAIEMLSWC
jgi:hypothetical protein